MQIISVHPQVLCAPLLRAVTKQERIFIREFGQYSESTILGFDGLIFLENRIENNCAPVGPKLLESDGHCN